MLHGLLYIVLSIACCKTQTDCSMQKKDIVFVLDDTGSVTAAEFQAQLSFFTMLANMYTINTANNIQVGLAYGGGFNGPALGFLLNSNGDSNTNVVNMIDAIVQQGGLTDTKKSLQLVREQIFAGTAVGDRADAANVVILVTCGVSVDPNGAIAQANLLRSEDNAEIFVLTISVADLTEAQGIASDPDMDHLISLPTFAALPATLATILAAACDTCNPVCQNGGFCDRANNRCTCPAGFAGTRCELQLFTTCIHPYSCGGVTNGQYAFCGSCKKYVTCTNGVMKLFKCSGTQVYMASNGACVIDTGSICSVSSMTSAAPPVTKKPFTKFRKHLFPSFHNGCDFSTGCVSSCSSMHNGLYPSCSSCTHFMACTDQTTTHKNCRWPYEFDDHSKSCSFWSSTCRSSFLNFNFGNFGFGGSSGYGTGSSGSSNGYGSGSSGYSSGSSSGSSSGYNGFGSNFFSNPWWGK